jgi:hypothetical protein
MVKYVFRFGDGQGIVEEDNVLKKKILERYHAHAKQQVSQ